MQNAAISEWERTLSSVLIAASMAVGLLFPALSAALFPHFLAALFCLVVFSLNSQPVRPTKVLVTPDKFTGLMIMWQMLGLPLIVSIIALAAGASTLLISILLAVTTAGSVFASPALVQMVGLNHQMAMRGMILSTCVMPVSLLVFGELNGVLPPDLSFRAYGLHIVVLIIIPLLMSFALFMVKPFMPLPAQRGMGRSMHWLSTLSLMVFCCGIMAKMHRDESATEDLLFYGMLATTLAVTMYALTVAVFYGFGPDKALTAGMLAANRNVALSFALISSVFPPEVMTFVAVSQFPIFLAPVIARLFLHFRGTSNNRPSAELPEAS